MPESSVPDGGTDSSPGTEIQGANHPGDSASAPENGAEAPTEEQMVVVATVPPLATLAQRIGGDAVFTRSLIPAGRSPHNFEPPPSAMRDLMRAEVVISVGSPTFAYEGRLLEPLLERRSPRPPVVSLVRIAEQDPALQLAREGAGDVHPWLHPQLLLRAADEIALTLASVDPEGAPRYAEGARSFRAEVERLDARNRALFEAASCRAFLVDHPAWEAFALHYGLLQLAIEEEGKTPGPATVSRVVAAARREGVVQVWQRPGHPASSVLAVAEALDGEVVEIDPTAADLLGSLERAAQLIVDGCRPAPSG
ncbi:MAG: zinc ABC transporter substrate-binding protein [Acidobacteriota bacterium]